MAGRRLDLTGQRYGALTVLAPAENVGRQTAWRCRCSCGQEVTVQTRRLRGGQAGNCGGPSHAGGEDTPRPARVRRSNNTSGVPGVDWMEKKQRWRAAICFQGKRRYLGSYRRFEDAVAARKRAEEALSDTFLEACAGERPEGGRKTVEEVCPPIPRDPAARRLDLTGRRFGQLTALEPAESTGASAWRCRCDCGRETVVALGHLRSGHTTSCGCKPKATFVNGTCVELIRSLTRPGSVRANNTSGATGVEWLPAAKRWRAMIFFQGKRRYLGSYQCFEDAVAARKQAEEALFQPFLAEFSRSAPPAERVDSNPDEE